MSMKADLLNPELGYFDEGKNLATRECFETATRSFGEATVLPPVAYRSKIFAELENEKLWTRSWVPIGLLQQIPNPGDLLPFTIGFHGVHVQRNHDGSISARSNFHQHGGCRFVPQQCRTGEQTKCTITSCAFTRDADVIPGGVDGEDTELMYKYVGINPDKLIPVNCETWGPFILINLDPECAPLSAELGGIPEAIIQRLMCHENISGAKWCDFLSNWKHAGCGFVDIFSDVTRSILPNFVWDGEECSSPAYVMEDLTLPENIIDVIGTREKADLCWLFPNLLIFVAETHAVCVIMQATAMGKSLHRVFLLHSENSVECPDTLLESWLKVFDVIEGEAVKLQDLSEKWGSASLPDTSVDALPRERSLATYSFQRYLVKRLLEDHNYYWNAPIMDAGFVGSTR